MLADIMMMKIVKPLTIGAVLGFQAVFAFAIMSMGTTCPAWLNHNLVFLFVYILPLLFVLGTFSLEGIQ